MNLKEKIPRWIIKKYVQKKKFSRRVVLKGREINWTSRKKPDFLIIGAMRAGTTSLHSYLSQHPHLLPSFVKEVHFFDGGRNDSYEKGEKWYRAHFPLKRKMKENQKTFETTPSYIFNPLVPQRINEYLPDAKLIVLLRNPVDRAISHYFSAKRINWEHLPIDQALREEEKRLKPIFEKGDFKHENFIRYSYKRRGLYKEQIERYYKYFSKQQLLIIKSEDLFSKPGETLKSIFNFLEVDSDFKVENVKVKNASANKKRVESDTYDYLNEYFLPHNQSLYSLIDRNFDW